MNSLANMGAALLGGKVAGIGVVGGGSLSQLIRLTLTDGRQVIVKAGPAPRLEAEMLRAIRAAGVPAPQVLAVDDKVLVIELLASGSRLGGAWKHLGGVLATLHAAHGERYGWSEDYTFGPVAIENGWSDDWPAFWAERRLLVNVPFVGVGLARRIETLAADLSNRLPKRPVRSLLHGDLWGGNVLVSEGRVTGLVDPACYYGHGEVDIAMLMLFDYPTPVFYSAYGRLESGADERLAIYRLWPALVHLRLFGDGYRALVEGMLSEVGV
jgi:fructosamine-3-kinase